MVVNTTMLTSLLIAVILNLYNFVRSHIQNIKELKRRCAHGVCQSSAGKEDRERLDRIVAVMADVAASVLAKLKNKAKASGFSTQITGYIKIVLILLPDILLTSYCIFDYTELGTYRTISHEKGGQICRESIGNCIKRIHFIAIL